MLIGKDTRISGYLLEAALESGLSAAGVDVYLSGPLPTPAVAYLTRALRLSAGIVVSASHNPFDDNGIKFFGANGAKLAGRGRARDRAHDGGAARVRCVGRPRQGAPHRRRRRALHRVLQEHVSERARPEGPRASSSTARTAPGYHVAPPVFDELGADVIAVGAEPNGTNINEGVGATHPEHLRQAVLEHRADIGIALDGDGDRLLMADSEGRLYDGDQLLYVIAADYRARGALGDGVVGTLMSNLGFEQALGRAGIALERAPVGDRYVLERMIEKGWQLGGENSGHLLCLDKHSTGDAIIAALAVLRALNGRTSSLATAAAPVTLFPQRLINVRLPKGFDWKGSAAIRAAEADARATLGASGRILLRPSGTEPVLRVMVEAADRTIADRCAQRVADSIAATLAAAAD